jgi:hypothetical protein
MLIGSRRGDNGPGRQAGPRATSDSPPADTPTKAVRSGFIAFFVREGIGEDVFPTISVSQLFERHPVLRRWTPGWIPDPSQWPEFAQLVEV